MKIEIKPKYDVGQNVYFISRNGNLCNGKITDILSKKEDITYAVTDMCNHVSLFDEELIFSRNIDAILHANSYLTADENQMMLDKMNSTISDKIKHKENCCQKIDLENLLYNKNYSNEEKLEYIIKYLYERQPVIDDIIEDYKRNKLK